VRYTPIAIEFTLEHFMKLSCETPPLTPNRTDYMPRNKDELTKTIGFRAPPRLRERFEKASIATNKDIAHLALKCAERSLDEVVKEEMDSLKDEIAGRERAAREFFKTNKAA
jgi:hypothetical protein